MTRKGGGRESGVRERSTEVGERTTVPERARKDAAANPAALDILRSRRDFIDPVTYRKILAAFRVLEAELAALRKEAVKGSWRFRAEKSEARVKELTELVEIAAT